MNYLSASENEMIRVVSKINKSLTIKAYCGQSTKLCNEMINTIIYRITSNKCETNDMHPNGSRDQFNFANELMYVILK